MSSSEVRGVGADAADFRGGAYVVEAYKTLNIERVLRVHGTFQACLVR